MTAEHVGAVHIPHEADELCESGSAVYTRALCEGRIRCEDTSHAPCLLDLGLLHPDVDDQRWLLPTAPAVALPRLLCTIEDRVARHRRREEKLAATFEPFLAIDTSRLPDREISAITVLEGLPRINAALDRALDHAHREVLTVQPGGVRPPESLAEALPRDQAMLDKGCRSRALYQHTTRHSLPALAHYERLRGDVEVRTLDEVTERLIVLDRSVAFIPANEDRTLALELRHPALVEHLATTFDRLWRLATPMWPQTASQPAENGITTRQRAIAAFLTEGLNDTEIATRLGMNVRTARVHIAKLSSHLGSHSRTQLGYLIGQSGILDRRRPEHEP
ncbi:LuxR C-terminal-related transcriptional regulator [Streptomyces sp. NPDC048441]|uniref:helix-turn-helix transcriptional regulator n=1 Tax=Streptomyces sp. NPDC048441 TaxID=3365552 RepID=UPI003720B3E1